MKNQQQTKYTLLGAQVDALTITGLIELVTEIVDCDKQRIIAHHNLHSLYLYHHDFKLQNFYQQANCAFIDGMALVFLGQVLGLPLQRKHRVTYVDWIWDLMAEAERQGWRMFYLGSKPGVAEKGAQRLRQQFPNLQMATAHGYFDIHPQAQENKTVLAAINSYRPQILLVGMGMPRQEYWISNNLESLSTNVILTSGACIDYIAGVLPTPPRWMGRWGLEWLYRLLSEPRRLWKRYLWEPWFVFTLFLHEWLTKFLCSPSRR